MPRLVPFILRCLLLVIFFTISPIAIAQAHAIVTSSTPALNAEVAGPDVNLEVHFNSRIDHARSRLTLIAPDSGEKQIPLSAEKNPEILSGTAQGLTAGAYRLRWQVLSVDGHITRGDILFSVK